jgi:long-chain acyl-CoA synthetase
VLVHEFLEASAERTPCKLALICDGERLTYEQLEENANRVASGLREAGVERGDRAAVWLANSVDAVTAIMGILKAGATFVVINPTTKPAKLAYVLSNCQARCLFAPEARAAQVTTMMGTLPDLALAVLCGGPATTEIHAESSLLRIDDLLAGSVPGHPGSSCIDLDLACLIYTSGSTGDPKGVMETHANVDFATSSIIDYLGNVPDDIVINVLPLSFDYGLYQLLMTIKFGGTLVLERSFAYPAAILNRIGEERVTGLPGVPTLFAMLLQMDLSRFELGTLRYLTNTAAALPVAHIQQLRAAFPWARLYSMYGLTECKRTLYLPPEELDRRPGSVGVAIPGTEVWVEDEAGQRLGPGQMGELVVRGSHVMQGYWRDPVATAERYRPGRYPAERLLYTGDLFRADEDGFLYFVARKDDIIKSRGEKVAPKEVESVLYQLPGVVEAAVIGVPDAVLGQAVQALIIAAPDANVTERDVLRHCRQHLEDFAVPKSVEFRKSLPKTASGKIDKRALR